jgi:OmpA-OmpF porin, OOP family
MNLRKTALTTAAVFAALFLAILGAWWSALAVEARSVSAVKSRLLEDGITWAAVEADGLQVKLSGTAPNEAERFRAVNLVGSVVQSARIRDGMDVTAIRAIDAPRFSVEMLRNDDGISLIGLVPGRKVEAELTSLVKTVAQGMKVADMLETADYPAPQGWEAALSFGLEALKLLPRSKISVSADLVTVTAISTSPEEKRKLESDLARKVPEGLTAKIDISAPRPVLTPFTLRFVRDDRGARFDACSADSDRARDRILQAGSLAGVTGKTPCTIGLGVPTPRWAEAAEAGIKAVMALGTGTITFSDADVSLLAGVNTTQAVFDRVVGDLQAQLPPVFSLAATLPPKETATSQGPVEFTAKLDQTGQVELRGRLSDALQRDAVDSFARAHFGVDRVYTATRQEEAGLPEGWPIRVLAGIEALSVLHHGALTVQADLVEVTGVTGTPDGRARVAQILSGKLGQGETFKIDVSYDEQFDPQAALPTPEECAADLNAILTRKKITFAPGSAEIDADARGVLDALAEVLTECPPLEMEIAGHTDSQGSEGGNRALSQARAEAVLTALQGRRIPVEVFVAKGYGEDQPIADNGTEEGREANRRIEFKLLSKPAPVAAPSPVAAAVAAVAATRETPAPQGGIAETTAEGAAPQQVAAAEVDPMQGSIVRSVTIPEAAFEEAVEESADDVGEEIAEAMGMDAPAEAAPEASSEEAAQDASEPEAGAEAEADEATESLKFEASEETYPRPPRRP